MTKRDADFDAQRIHHLDMIQAVIARLSKESFLIKGWALTVAGAFFGFSITTTRPALAWAGIMPVVLFWLLDVHFLRAERMFRVLFDYVRKGTSSVEPFFMAATGRPFARTVRADTDAKAAASWLNTARRPTLVIFYGTLVVVAIGLALLVGAKASILQPSHTPSP